MLLLYVCAQLGKIQASAKKVLVPKIKSLVQEGECYVIENVLVTHNEPKYRCIWTQVQTQPNRQNQVH